MSAMLSLLALHVEGQPGAEQCQGHKVLWLSTEMAGELSLGGIGSLLVRILDENPYQSLVVQGRLHRTGSTETTSSKSWFIGLGEAELVSE